MAFFKELGHDIKDGLEEIFKDLFAAGYYKKALENNFPIQTRYIALLGWMIGIGIGILTGINLLACLTILSWPLGQ